MNEMTEEMQEWGRGNPKVDRGGGAAVRGGVLVPPGRRRCRRGAGRSDVGGGDGLLGDAALDDAEAARQVEHGLLLALCIRVDAFELQRAIQLVEAAVHLAV